MALTKSYLIDSPSFYIDVDTSTIDTLDLSTQATKLLGLTKGGCKFSAKPTLREMEFDGKLDKKVKGMNRITGWDVSAETEAFEFNDNMLKLSLLEKQTSTSTKYDLYAAVDEFLADTSYHNILIVGKLFGTSTPIMIEIKNVLNEEGFAFEQKDKDEASYKMKLNANYDLTNLTKEPFTIFLPKA